MCGWMWLILFNSFEVGWLGLIFLLHVSISIFETLWFILKILPWFVGIFLVVTVINSFGVQKKAK
jgi:uncharacterized membrane protein YadS